MAGPFALTASKARRIWLHAQRLDQPAPFGDGAAATRAAVAHLGYVRLDTINVIERCHHHILYTRIPAYQRDHLRQAQTVGKTVFEYWTHALSYLPARDLPFYIRAMKRHWQRRSTWFTAVKQQDLRKVLALIKRQGPLTIRDIDDHVLVERDHLWASRKPSKRALQLAFYRGQVTISQRTGMLKTYELMNRHFGWKRPPRAASEKEILNYVLDRALRSQGVVSLDSVCYLDPRRKPAMRRLIETRMRRKELVPVALEGGSEARALGAARGARCYGGWRRGAGPHLVALRPAHPSAQAGAALLWLRAPLRGLRPQGEAIVRLLCPPRARGRPDRRRHRSQGRSRAAEAAGAAVDLDRQRPAPVAQAANRRSVAPLRALPARALTGLPNQLPP